MYTVVLCEGMCMSSGGIDDSSGVNFHRVGIRIWRLSAQKRGDAERRGAPRCGVGHIRKKSLAVQFLYRVVYDSPPSFSLLKTKQNGMSMGCCVVIVGTVGVSPCCVCADRVIEVKVCTTVRRRRYRPEVCKDANDGRKIVHRASCYLYQSCCDEQFPKMETIGSWKRKVAELEVAHERARRS
jgi:hypothetical protein